MQRPSKINFRILSRVQNRVALNTKVRFWPEADMVVDGVFRPTADIAMGMRQKRRLNAIPPVQNAERQSRH